MSDVSDQWDSDIEDDKWDNYIDYDDFDSDYGDVDSADGLDCIIQDSDRLGVEASSQHKEDAAIPLIPLPTNKSFLNRVRLASFVSWDPNAVWRMYQ